jgi:glutaredoxin
MAAAAITLVGRKSLTIYHENVEERFRQNVARMITKQSLIDYCKATQRGMFIVEEVQAEEKKQPPPPASPARAAVKAAEHSAEDEVLEQEEEQEQAPVEDDGQDTDPPSPRKPTRKRVKV